VVQAKIHMEFGAILIYGNSESEIYIWNFFRKPKFTYGNSESKIYIWNFGAKLT
jgi:hypothetical protein